MKRAVDIQKRVGEGGGVGFEAREEDAKRARLVEHMDEFEHIRRRPDTMIGTCAPAVVEMRTARILSDSKSLGHEATVVGDGSDDDPDDEDADGETRSEKETWNIATEKVRVSEGFLQTFREIVVNVADNHARTVANEDKATRTMATTIVVASDHYCVTNDGQPPPIAKCSIQGEEKWAIEAIFGTFRTSTNFDDSQQVRQESTPNSLFKNFDSILEGCMGILPSQGLHLTTRG